jgi:uncharacterized protein YeaO (DUF488 family)
VATIDVHDPDDDAFCLKTEAFRVSIAMIRTASVYDPPADKDGLRVLIMRYWPRGVRRERVDVWLKDAAPSRELLQAYTHQGLGWDKFEEGYRAEMEQDRPHVLEQLRDLEREHGTLTLLCHERIPPHEHCHRHTLQGLLARSTSRKASP